MVLHDLAEEFALTDDAAAALCARLGIPATWSGSMVTADDEARFRAAAHAELNERAADEPPLAASLPQSLPPPSGTPTAGPPPPPTGPDDTVGWAAPDAPEGPGPRSQTPPGWSTAPAAPTPTGPGFAPGFEPLAPGFGPPGQAPAFGAPPGVDPADWARLDQARAHARSLINQGIVCLALGLAITIGTMMLAPGGFFVVTLGTVFVGFRRIRAGQAIKAQIRAAEQQIRGG